MMSFDWCRQNWGDGPWDEWESDWLRWYPLEHGSSRVRQRLQEFQAVIPEITRALLHTRLAELRDEPIPSLFDLSSLAPGCIQTASRRFHETGRSLRDAPARQLAIFRWLQLQRHEAAADLRRRMRDWLTELGAET